MLDKQNHDSEIIFRMNSDRTYSNRYSITSAPSSGNQSKNMTEMSGCSTIDIDIARMFWKSFSLSPPIESKLFSPDIKQRRRTATASGKNYSLDTLKTPNSLGRSRKKQAEFYKSEISGIGQAPVYHYDEEEIKRKGCFQNFS